MKTKLNRSNIQISGQITISPTNSSMDNVVINLEGLKQSKSGIYEIRNKFNNKKYIGMAKDLDARKRHHWFDLIKGIHKSKEMQDDYNTTTVGGINHIEHILDISPDNIFEFNVILYCYPSQLTFYENLLITYLQPEYNTHKKKMVKLEKQFDESGNHIVSEETIMNLWSDDDCEEEMM